MSDVLLVGVPYRGGEVFAGRQDLAPERVRWARGSVEDASMRHGKAPSVRDVGDVPADLGSAAMRLATLDLAAMPPVFLGGDHTVSSITVPALAAEHEGLAVVHLDAHLDRRDAFAGSALNHATVMRRLEERGFTVATFGYRSRAPEEPTPALGAPHEVAEPLREALAALPDALFLSLDVDVLDPGVFPAVGNPEPGGVGFDELMEAIDLLAGRLVGAELVEFCPDLETGHACAATAAVLVRELACALTP